MIFTDEEFEFRDKAALAALSALAISDYSNEKVADICYSLAEAMLERRSVE